jgi:hypothetical protein
VEGGAAGGVDENPKIGRRVKKAFGKTRFPPFQCQR